LGRGGWLIGSVITGLLYERARRALIGFAVVAQLVSIPFFVLAARASRKFDVPSKSRT
jgi:hypothetical protein